MPESLFSPPAQSTDASLAGTGFEAIRGQAHACQILLSAFRSGRVPHAYLFVGPEGVGKRATALQWAKALNCASPASPGGACETCAACRKIQARNHPDVLWIGFEHQARLLNEPVDKQRSIKIDTVRDMEHMLRLKPLEGRVKIAFLEPADKLVEAAAHALLKILEEPPPQTHLVLLALDASQLLDTIRSRCQWVRFRPLPAATVAELLQQGPTGVTDEEALRIARLSEGSLSRARALLEGGEGMDFDWEAAPLSELLSWAEQFHTPRNGRAAAQDFLRRLLAQFQEDLRQGRCEEAELRRVLDALHQIQQNVSSQLVLETLLLRLRWDRKKARA